MCRMWGGFRELLSDIPRSDNRQVSPYRINGLQNRLIIDRGVGQGQKVPIQYTRTQGAANSVMGIIKSGPTFSGIIKHFSLKKDPHPSSFFPHDRP